MKAAVNPLQVAVYTLLTTDTGAGGLFETGSEMVNAVYDDGAVPEGVTYPYITLGDNQSLFWGAFAQDGEDIEMTLHIWTRERGFKDAGEILSRLNELLGDATLTVSGYQLARSNFERYSRVNDPEEGVQHVAVAYQVLMQES